MLCKYKAAINEQGRLNLIIGNNRMDDKSKVFGYIKPNTAQYAPHSAECHLIVQIHDGEVEYRSGDKRLSANDATNLIRANRRRRATFDHLLVALFVVFLPALSYEIWLVSKSFALDFIITFLPLMSIGFWIVMFLFFKDRFKVNIQFEVSGRPPQMYWKYRFSLARLFASGMVKRVTRRAKLAQEFKYNFNAAEEIYTRDIVYGKAKSVDVNFNIDTQAMSTPNNPIGDFVHGFTSGKMSPKIHFSTFIYRVFLSILMGWCGWKITMGSIPSLLILLLLVFSFAIHWFNLSPQKIENKGFLTNHPKMKAGCIALCIFLAFALYQGFYSAVGVLGLPDNSWNGGLVILIALLGSWFYWEIYYQEAWFILPNGIYSSITSEFYPYEYILDEHKYHNGLLLMDPPIPNDGSVVGHVWEHQNLDGGQDLRFKDNHLMANIHLGYVSLHTDFNIETRMDLDLILQVSDWYKAAEMVFWTSQDGEITADIYVPLMLFACVNTPDMIYEATGLDRTQFAEAIQDAVMQKSDPALIKIDGEKSVALAKDVLQIATRLELPKKNDDVVDKILRELDVNGREGKTLRTISSEGFTPQSSETPTLRYLNGDINLFDTKSPEEALTDVSDKPFWPRKLFWGVATGFLVIGSVFITITLTGNGY